METLLALPHSWRQLLAHHRQRNKFCIIRESEMDQAATAEAKEMKRPGLPATLSTKNLAEVIFFGGGNVPWAGLVA